VVDVHVRFSGVSRWLKDEGFTLEEQETLYEQCLLSVYNNPRYYLDNLEFLREFKVSWADYSSVGITKPYKYCKKNKKEDNKTKAL
jgi:hypothetical protein